MVTPEQIAAERHYCIAVARSLGCQPQDAEDHAQDAVISAMPYGSKIRPRALKWWLRVTVRNSVIDSWLKAKRRGEFSVVDAADLSDAHPQEGFGATYMREVNAAMARMLPHKRALLLDAGLGYCYAELAARHGIPKATVHSRLSRARSELRDILERGADAAITQERRERKPVERFALIQSNGRLRSRKGSINGEAARLGMSPTTLRKKLRMYGLMAPPVQRAA